MSHRLIVRPIAENDIRRAYRWYETELEGLGMRFLYELNEGFEKISANPRHYAEIAGGIRRKLNNKFPYGVFFCIRTSGGTGTCSFAARPEP